VLPAAPGRCASPGAAVSWRAVASAMFAGDGEGQLGHVVAGFGSLGHLGLFLPGNCL
jgi:hypothetical protein